jgi:SAM-dependent methyltransferase
MRTDIDRLQTFYASPLGRMAEEMIARRIATLWPEARDLDMLGYGYADGLLEPFRSQARRVVSASPDAQGVVRWPAHERCASAMVDEERLPFRDSLFDRLIVRHGLEEAEGPRRLLRELWRISAPEARILVIVAHRRGLWARSEATPFGHGQPYTRLQLYRLLEAAMFQPTASTRVLFAPPLGWKMITSAGHAWERIGSTLWPSFGGVLMIEAVKRLYVEPGGLRQPARRRVKLPVSAPARGA